MRKYQSKKIRVLAYLTQCDFEVSTLRVNISSHKEARQLICSGKQISWQCVKSVQIRRYSGPHFPTEYGEILNTETFYVVWFLEDGSDCCSFHCTKMKFFVKDFFSKCEQFRSSVCKLLFSEKLKTIMFLSGH